MSQATWQLLNDRRELHLKLLETNDELLQADLRQQVRQICKKIYRSSRNDRRLWADSIADHAQIAINTGNMRDLYKATKILAGKRSQRKKPLKSKDGQLIVTSEGQLRRWREYFEETFRPTALSTHGDPQDTSPPPRLLNIDVEPPTRDEVARAVMGLKTGRHQASEWQREIYLTFVDFEKAFDTLRWSSIWSRLSNIGVPPKIIKVKASCQNYSCRVTHDDLISDDIQVHAGVRQGCLLSPLLFLVVLDGIMHRTHQNKRRGIKWGLTNILEDLDYADELCLLSHTHRDMQSKLNDLEREARFAGL
ncbi:unnamed protein product [Pieris macdunnoughi]|uniref:Reverse transcriptase domain-containing protein n=1 Tax=Pieris macdunnoughi TaxID=345717 RepID=A0A821XKP6_9NEOP|nr:unnamed protein product [Pieris macdunnoughi]